MYRVRSHIIKSFTTCSRQLSTYPQICVVGSGPAGFYTTQQIIRGHPEARVDIYEKLPIPFGLVRYGVAPDHPEVKNCINGFTELARNNRVSFIGNVSIGKDVMLNQLRDAYHAIVLCYGAAEDRRLNIPGESLPNVLSARRFVGWYNGYPEDVNIDIDLDVEEAVVIGQGNVAIDVARILLRSVDDLKKTDIPESVLERFTKSRIKRVTMVGRRRAQEVAFTAKEGREMIKLKDCRPVFRKEDFEPLASLLPSAPRHKKRVWDMLYKTSCEPSATQLQEWQVALKEWRLRFLLSPLEILGNESSNGIVGIRCGVNRVENEKAESTGEEEILNCGLVLKSVGYTGVHIDSSMPFNENMGAISNVNGKVLETKGMYVSGWIGTGPIGVLLSTMESAFQTGEILLSDMKSGNIPLSEKEGKKKIMQILEGKEIRTTSFEDWSVIDKVELENGKKLNKSREKVTSVEEMLKIAHKDQIL